MKVRKYRYGSFDIAFAITERGSLNKPDRHAVWFIVKAGKPACLSNNYASLEDAETAAYLFAQEHNLIFVPSNRRGRT